MLTKGGALLLTKDNRTYPHYSQPVTPVVLPCSAKWTRTWRSRKATLRRPRQARPFYLKLKWEGGFHCLQTGKRARKLSKRAQDKDQGPPKPNTALLGPTPERIALLRQIEPVGMRVKHKRELLKLVVFF